MWLLHSMITILVAVIKQSPGLLRGREKDLPARSTCPHTGMNPSSGQPLCFQKAACWRDSVPPQADNLVALKEADWKRSSLKYKQDFGTEWLKHGVFAASPLRQENCLSFLRADCKYPVQQLLYTKFLHGFENGPFLARNQRKSCQQPEAACKLPCLLPYDFLDKPARKIANDDHMITGHLAT